MFDKISKSGRMLPNDVPSILIASEYCKRIHIRSDVSYSYPPICVGDLISKFAASTHLVIGLESLACTQMVSCVTDAGHVTHEALPSWDCPGFMQDPSGVRLFEEVARRCKVAIEAVGRTVDSISITLPGATDGLSVLGKSSRLGVMQRIDVGPIFSQLKLPPVTLLKDVECLAMGEIHAEAGSGLASRDFAYVFVDEGVGSALYLNGEFYRGAGFAGPIGRLIVEPDGAYNRVFHSRGPLEVFLGRPFLSESIVNQYLTELGKGAAAANESRAFRNSVSAVANSDPRSLSYAVMRMGLDEDDPVATVVVDKAASYLGLAINSLITIINPPVIVLAGAVICNLPSLAVAAVSYARRFSWELAWNRTQIIIGTGGRDRQYLGAALLAHKIAKQV